MRAHAMAAAPLHPAASAVRLLLQPGGAAHASRLARSSHLAPGCQRRLSRGALHVLAAGRRGVRRTDVQGGVEERVRAVSPPAPCTPPCACAAGAVTSSPRAATAVRPLRRRRQGQVLRLQLARGLHGAGAPVVTSCLWAQERACSVAGCAPPISCMRAADARHSGLFCLLPCQSFCYNHQPTQQGGKAPGLPGRAALGLVRRRRGGAPLRPLRRQGHADLSTLPGQPQADLSVRGVAMMTYIHRSAWARRTARKRACLHQSAARTPATCNARRAASTPERRFV